jgi:hypothetical protein
VNETKVRIGNICRSIRSDLEVASRESDRILRRKGELGSATAQRFYRMRCECGRSWIELELKKLVKCPACSRLNQVHTRLQTNEVAPPRAGAAYSTLPILQPAPGFAKKSSG